MHIRMRCCSYSLCTFPSQVLKYNLYYIYSQLFTCTSLIKLGQYTVELWLNISHTCKYTKNMSQWVGIPNTVSLCIPITIPHSWISASFSWLHQVLLKTRFIWLIVNQECGSYLININIFLFWEKKYGFTANQLLFVATYFTTYFWYTSSWRLWICNQALFMLNPCQNNHTKTGLWQEIFVTTMLLRKFIAHK